MRPLSYTIFRNSMIPSYMKYAARNMTRAAPAVSRETNIQISNEVQTEIDKSKQNI